MAENILKRLVNNSQMAIDDGTYEIDANLQKSSKDLIHIISTNPHPTLLTESIVCSLHQFFLQHLSEYSLS